MHLRDLTRRLASSDDMESLFTINQRVMRDHVLAAFGRWDEQEQREMFFRSTDLARHEMLLHDHSAIGFWCVKRTVDEICLQRISILPEYQGRGLGTSLIRELMSEAAHSSIPVRLRVFKTNRARKLYRMLGFQEERRSEHHIHMVYFA